MGLPILFCTGSLGSSLAQNLPDQAGPGGSHQKSQLRCQGSWGMELHPPRDSPLLVWEPAAAFCWGRPGLLCLPLPALCLQGRALPGALTADSLTTAVCRTWLSP